MQEEAEYVQVFTPEMLETIAYIWTRSTISLIDVRHQHIHPEHPLQHYRMPSNMLVYVYGGTANVQLNETTFSMERFGIFHGGKATTLSILPDAVTLGCFMVFYKAETPILFKKDLQRLLEHINPFVQQFGCAPSNPLWLMRLFEQMMDSWSRATSMNHFHSKSLFYLSMHQIYKDLELGEVKILQPDMVATAKRYLDEHYTQPISMQAIANMFSISGGQLTRLFKGREGKSLQEYLIQKRLDAACDDLINTDATIKEIAAGCGFMDEINLIRMFKKHYRMTPGSYRKNNAMTMPNHDIDNGSQRLYNEMGLEDLAKFQRDGELTMFGQARSKQMILAAAMSLMLLLSACGTVPANNTNGAGAQNTPTVESTTQSPAAATKAEAAFPRTYVDTTGAEVVINKQPERVAVLHFGMAEMVYALGAPLIAAPMLEQIGEMVTLQPLLRDANLIELGAPVSPDLEKLIDAAPDVILGWADYHGDVWDSVGQIAPLVSMISYYDHGLAVSLREHGKLLGREEQAEQLIAQIEGKLAAARAQLSSLDETVVALSYWNNGQSGWIANSTYTSFYSEEEGLGLKAPEQLQGSYSEAMSLEGLVELNPDHIFIRGTQENFDQTIAELAKFEVWNTLTAVRNNQVYPIEESTYNGGPLGIQLWADYAIETLLK